jgi:hypothetical protein
VAGRIPPTGMGCHRWLIGGPSAREDPRRKNDREYIAVAGSACT